VFFLAAAEHPHQGAKVRWPLCSELVTLVEQCSYDCLNTLGFHHQKWQAGWWYTYPSEKYEFVSWDDYSRYMEKTCSKPSTRLGLIHPPNLCIVHAIYNQYDGVV
jgi:hypothetical protein